MENSFNKYNYGTENTDIVLIMSHEIISNNLFARHKMFLSIFFGALRL